MFDIVISPNLGLREVCEAWDIEDPRIPEIAENMIETMYANGGCGLAGPQVAVQKRIIVIDVDEHVQNPFVLINPEIVELKGEELIEEEGCLSIPGITVPIKRREFARVQFYGLDKKRYELAGDGLLGRCLQHEIDHLNGITLFEAASAPDRIRALQDYELARKAGARPGDTSI